MFTPLRRLPYQNQGSLSLLNDLIAEIQFPLSSSPSLPLETPLTTPLAPTTNVIIENHEVKKEEVKTKKTKESKGKSLPERGEGGDSSETKPTASSSESNFTVNSLDLRVGIIVKVQRHESAEKLYCEEIDVGEETPRSIASGLVH